MNISAIDRSQSAKVKPKSDKMGVMVAQRSLEAAMQNQAKEKAGLASQAKGFAHPYLGHNVDIYV